MIRASLLGLLALGASTVGAASIADADRKVIEDIVREYLLANPDVVIEAAGRYQAKQAAEAKQRQTDALAQLRNEVHAKEIPLILGSLEADVSIVEFSDYNCGYCRKSFDVLRKLVDKDQRSNVVLKELPVLSPVSTYASRAALAARIQGKYAELHTELMTSKDALTEASVIQTAERLGLDTDRLQADMNSPEIDREIEENLALAQSLGITGTPAFIIGDQIIPGAVSTSRLAAAVRRARAEDQDQTASSE